jgi:hypothetical protein
MAAGAALVASAPAQASAASDLVTQIAAALQGMVGKQPSSDVGITGITAEGETLVVKIDGPKDWRADKTPAQLTNAFLNGYCAKAAATFDTGMKLRVDTTENGGAQLWQGPTIDRCPAT